MGLKSARVNGPIGNTAWGRRMHAAHVAKYRYYPTLRQRTIKGNRHPETTPVKRPNYESTLELGYIPRHGGHQYLTASVSTPLPSDRS